MEMQFSMKEHFEDTFVSETGATSVARTRKPFECHDTITLPQHYLTFIVYPVNVIAKRREHNVVMGPFIIFTLRK